MWYLDEALEQQFTEIIGKKPDFYFFTLEGWRIFAVPAGKTVAMTGTPYMLAWSGTKIYMMPTGLFSTAKWFPEKVEILEFKKVTRATKKRFLWAHYFTLEFKDGTQKRWVANTFFYLRLKKQKEGILRFAEKLTER